MYSLLSHKHIIQVGIVFIALLVLNTSCTNSTEPEVVTQLLLNSDIETGTTSPEHWDHYTTTGIDSPYVFQWATDESVSPSHSLMISLDVGQDWFQESSWTQDVLITPGEYRGKDLILEASFMMKNVTAYGRGVFLAIDTYNNHGTLLKSSNTQDSRIIIGTRYWHTVTLNQLNIPDTAGRIVVRIGLGIYSRGIVYFDNVALSVLTNPNSH